MPASVRHFYFSGEMFTFARVKKYLSILVLVAAVACQKQQIYAPAASPVSNRDLIQSRERNRKLNDAERSQISKWIAGQEKKFYSAGLNYWTTDEKATLSPRKPDGFTVSYEYEIFDFNMESVYSRPIRKTNQVIGRFDEVKAVEDALRHMNTGESATLLVPSVLAFGTYGDGDEIPGNMPLVITLKVL